MKQIYNTLLFVALSALMNNSLKAQSGQIDLNFMVGSGANNLAQELQIFNDDKIFFGGNFTNFNTASVNRVVKLLANGAHDFTFLTYTPPGGVDGPLRSSALQSDSKLLVGGLFNNATGFPSKNIARFNTNGNLDTLFSTAIGTGFNNEVTSLATHANRIFAAGFFTQFNGTPFPSFACINLNGAIDTSFFIPNQTFISISDIEVAPNGQVYIAGNFTSYGGTSISRVARLHTNGTLDTTFNPGTGPSGLVNAIKLQADGKLLIGGTFSTVNGVSSTRIARLNTNGSVDTTFNVGTGASSNVRAIALQTNGKVIIAGDFTTYNSISSPRVARLLPNGVLDTSFSVGTGTNGTVYSIGIQSTGDIILSGNFSNYNSVTVGRVIRLLGEPCTLPDSASITASADTVICPNGNSILSISSGNLYDSTGTWYWYADTCGSTPIDTGTSISVMPNSTSTYYVRGISGCGAGLCSPITIYVKDTFPPIPDTLNLPTIYASCSTTLIPPTAYDSCKGSITATTNSPLTITTQGNHSITWEYNDGNGNTSTQIQNVIINDSIAPVPVNAQLNDIIASCSVLITSFPMANDNCVGTITATTQDTLVYNTIGNYSITWTYDDGNGNTTTQTQNVIIVDSLAPNPDITNLADITANCSASITNFPTATDNCKGQITATTNDSLQYHSIGTYTITWQYDDGNGNTSTQTQNVIVIDSIAPIPDSALLADIVVKCAYTFTTFPTATDNCAGQVVATSNNPLHYSGKGNYSIVWEYSDGNGNTSSQTQNLILLGLDTTIKMDSSSYPYYLPMQANYTSSTASYQWFTCNNSTINLLSADTNQTFNPNYNTGYYGVIISDSGCVDTSSCVYLIIYINSIEETHLQNEIKIYPNPTTDAITIQSKFALKNAVLRLYNINGQLVDEKSLQAEHAYNYNLSSYKQGIYFCEILINGNISRHKIVKH